MLMEDSEGFARHLILQDQSCSILKGTLKGTDLFSSLKGTDLFSWLVPLNENLPLTQVGIGAKSIMLNCRAKR